MRKKVREEKEEEAHRHRDEEEKHRTAAPIIMATRENVRKYEKSVAK